MEQSVAAERRTVFSSLSGYFTPNQWIAYTLILVIGIAFRWYALDMRPVHHDESQHGMFGRYFFDAPDVHFYRYNPMLHGPLLYNLYRLVYNCIGSDIWSFRVPMAFLGTLYLFLPLLFRRWFSPRALLFLTAAIALGPSLIYWSRFAREDFYVLFGLFSMLIGAAGLFPRWSGSLVIFGFVIQLCSKANIFVHLAIILAYVFFEVFFRFALRLLGQRRTGDILFHGAVVLTSFGLMVFIVSSGLLFSGAVDVRIMFSLLFLIVTGVFIAEAVHASRQIESETLLSKSVANLKLYWREFSIGFIFSAAIYCYLYSAGGRYPWGIVSGLGFDAIAYWINQHSIERISGPFLFQFYTLSWYELPFILFYLLHVAHFYTRDRFRMTLGGGILAVSVLVTLIFGYYQIPVNENSLCKFLGVKDLRDLFGVPLLLLHPLIVTATHLIENRHVLAIWGYLFTSFFFSYSYLKEKVPWLSMYPLILGIIYLVLYFDAALHEQPLQNRGRARWSSVLFLIASVLISLGLIFVGEGYFYTNPDMIAESTVLENSGFLAFGLVFMILALLEQRIRLMGEFCVYTVLLLVVVVYNVRMAFITNFVKPGHASEYISQVHTTPEFHAMTLQIREKMTASVNGIRPLVLGRGESTWPITWYMAGVEGFNFDIPSGKSMSDYEYIFDSWDDNQGLKKIPAGFIGRQLEFRGWWVPDFNVISLRRFLRYAINHTPWNSTGFTYLLYMSKDHSQK